MTDTPWAILRVGDEPVVTWLPDAGRGGRPRFEVLLSGWLFEDAESGARLESDTGTGVLAGTPVLDPFDAETMIRVGGHTLAELRVIAREETG